MSALREADSTNITQTVPLSAEPGVRSSREYKLIEAISGRQLERNIGGELILREAEKSDENALLRLRLLPLRTNSSGNNVEVFSGDICVLRATIPRETEDGIAVETISLGYDPIKGYGRDYTTLEVDTRLLVRTLQKPGKQLVEGDSFVLVSPSGNYFSASDDGTLCRTTSAYSSATVWRLVRLDERSQEETTNEEETAASDFRVVNCTPERIYFSGHEGVAITVTLSLPPTEESELLIRLTYQGEAMEVSAASKSGDRTVWSFELPQMAAAGLLSVSALLVSKDENGKTITLQAQGSSRIAILRDDIAMAINCGGDSYTSTDGIEYDGELDKEGNDVATFVVGNRRMAPIATEIDYQCFTRTEDGYIYASGR